MTPVTFDLQPQKDLHFLLEINGEYKGLLGCFPEIIAVHKVLYTHTHNPNHLRGGASALRGRVLTCVCQAAVEKVKDSDRLLSAGRINNEDRKCMKHRLSCMNYALQGNHSNHSNHGNRV